MAIDPDVFSGGAFGAKINDLTEALTGQDGTRLPGSRRVGARSGMADGVEVDDGLLERIRAFV